MFLEKNLKTKFRKKISKKKKSQKKFSNGQAQRCPTVCSRRSQKKAARREAIFLVSIKGRSQMIPTERVIRRTSLKIYIFKSFWNIFQSSNIGFSKNISGPQLDTIVRKCFPLLPVVNHYKMPGLRNIAPIPTGYMEPQMFGH